MRPVRILAISMAMAMASTACKPGDDAPVDTDGETDGETDDPTASKRPGDYEIDPDAAQTYDATLVVGKNSQSASFVDVLAHQVHTFQESELRVRDFVGRKLIENPLEQGPRMISAELRVLVPAGAIEPGTYDCVGADTGGYGVTLAFYGQNQTVPSAAFGSLALPADSTEPCSIEITQSTLKRFVAHIPAARVVGPKGTGATLENVSLDLTLRER